MITRDACREDDQEFSKVSRLEVIGPDGREYVRYFKEDECMRYELQDDERTLKIFLSKNDG